MEIINKKTQETLNQIQEYVIESGKEINEKYEQFTSIVPCKIIINNVLRTYFELECDFESEDEKNSYEKWLTSILKYIWEKHDQLIVYIYTKVETFIATSIQDKARFRKYCKRNNGLSTISNMINYLCDEKGINLDEIYKKAVKLWDEIIRPMRNIIIHNGIDREQLICDTVSKLLKEPNISSNLLEIFCVCIEEINISLSAMRCLLISINDIV